MTTQQKLVLFADDFPDNRDLYGQFLSASGFRVALATNGEEAVAQAVELQPDVIILDLSMPILDGAEAAQQIRCDSRTSAIPILLLTAYGPEEVPNALRSQCQGILEKPCKPNHMVEEVRRVFN